MTSLELLRYEHRYQSVINMLADMAAAAKQETHSDSSAYERTLGLARYWALVRARNAVINMQENGA